MEILNKLYKEQMPYFLMAVAYLGDIGFKRAAKLTDEEIAEVKANTDPHSVISADLNEWLMQTAREIANNVTPTQLFQWMQVNKPYDTHGIKKAR